MANPMASFYTAILWPPTHGHPMTIRHLVRKKLWPVYSHHPIAGNITTVVDAALVENIVSQGFHQAVARNVSAKWVT